MAGSFEISEEMKAQNEKQKSTIIEGEQAVKNIFFAVFFMFLFIPAIALAGGNEKEQSFYKYPDSKVLHAGSFWNPLVTAKDGKKVSETYYKYPDSKTLPAGSIWNPLVTTKDGKKVSETYYKYPDSKTLPAGSIWNPYVTVKERGKRGKK